MANNVFLDAIIPREDFEVKEESKSRGSNINTIAARDLEKDSFFFHSLRKPDFQRETNEWDPERVVSLIESFLEGDLIPAVILWKNGASFTFVIDGAHRLSALAAWINDDFGDGDISKKFYDGIIPEEQITLAEKTRNLVRKKIGPFSDFKLALTNPEKVNEQILEKSKTLGTLAIQVQWVEGDEHKAELSFFKINQKATIIDKTELKLLKTRRKPNGIATRAILRSGKGHKYWSAYNTEDQEAIQNLAKDIHNILFTPKLKGPVKTLDLPIGGKTFSAQSQSLILNLVNRVNGIDSIDDGKIPEDDTGEITKQYLKKVLKLLQRINSLHPSSLGLHPAIYFYAKDGRYKPVSFSATIELIMELDKQKKFNWFTKARARFEEFLQNYDYMVQNITRKYRSGSLAQPHIKNFYMSILEELQTKSVQEAINNIIERKEYSYLTINDENNHIDMFNEITSNTFNTLRKSEVFFAESLKNTIKCKICGAALHINAMTVDHIKRKRDGGLATVENGQLTHPYCNTTFKN